MKTQSSIDYISEELQHSLKHRILAHVNAFENCFQKGCFELCLYNWAWSTVLSVGAQKQNLPLPGVTDGAQGGRVSFGVEGRNACEWCGYSIECSRKKLFFKNLSNLRFSIVLDFLVFLHQVLTLAIPRPLVLGRYAASSFSSLLHCLPCPRPWLSKLMPPLKCVVQRKPQWKGLCLFRPSETCPAALGLCVRLSVISSCRVRSEKRFFCSVCRYNHHPEWRKCGGNPTMTWPSGKDAKRKLFRNIVNLTSFYFYWWKLSWNALYSQTIDLDW